MPQELRERPRSSSQSSSRDVPRQEKPLGRVQPPSNLLTLPRRSRNWFKLCQAIRASAEQIKIMAKDLVARCSIGTGVSNACACGKGPARVFGDRKGSGYGLEGSGGGTSMTKACQSNVSCSMCTLDTWAIPGSLETLFDSAHAHV